MKADQPRWDKRFGRKEFATGQIGRYPVSLSYLASFRIFRGTERPLPGDRLDRWLHDIIQPSQRTDKDDLDQPELLPMATRLRAQKATATERPVSKKSEPPESGPLGNECESCAELHRHRPAAADTGSSRAPAPLGSTFLKYGIT